MNLFNFPIKRPVTVAMVSIMVFILGMISWFRLPLDLMPEISFPNLSVAVRYEGAGPEEIEERVGKILESAIKATANIKNVKVTAQEELCFVNAEFNWGSDLDEASADIREKIASVRDFLPEDIDEPIVLRINLQEFPVLFLHIDDETGTRNLADVADIAKDEIAPQIERLPGVATAATLGGLIREVQVNCDVEKMEKYKVGFSDVINAIRYRNLDLTTGYIDHASMRFRVKGEAQFQTVEDIENVIIGYGLTTADRQMIAMRPLIPYTDHLAGEGALSPIRVGDVAEVVDTFKEKRGLVRIYLPGSEPSEGVGMAVMKETDANMVQVADVVIAQLEQIQETLPAGIRVSVSFDLSEIIKDSISALYNAAAEGGILATIVIFVFLWQIRPSIIVITSIPLSLLACFVAMYFADFTLNIMTLGGMVIAVGKLVDDSIVVLENIYRHIQLGEHPHQAAEEGFREVATAVVSATLVAVIIFLPVAFTEGLSAQLFRTFAGTIFFSLMASLAVAFTLIPMLSSRLLRKETEEEIENAGPIKRFFLAQKRGHERVWEGIANIYHKILAWAVDTWGMVLALAVALLWLTGALMALMVIQGNYEFVPRLVGNLYRANVELPPGALMEETDKVMNEITDIMREEVPDLRSLFMVVGQSGDPGRAAMTGSEQGMNEGEMNIRLYKQVQIEEFAKEGKIIPRTSDQKLRGMWDEFALDHPNVEISFMQAGSLDFSNEKPIIIKIYGDDFDTMKRISKELAAEVRKIEGTRDVTTSMEQGVPEYRYSFDRDRLGLYMMPAGMVLTEADTALGGNLASLYREGGKEYDITVQMKEEQREYFDDIRELKILTPLGFHVPLRDVADFEFDEGPLMIRRENSKRLVTVEANKTETASLGELGQEIIRIIDEYPAPEGYIIEFGGELEDLQDAFTDLALMFMASLILVYLILASLYESLIHPVTIMIAIPLAFTGAVAALFITNTAFGVTAFIGMIMLVGIVATNSIVLMDFILEFHREKGLPRREAILEAGRTRLRPILMTAMTTLFGVFPIALGRAEGMELQQPLGIVMVGGLVTSTILTLVVIPVMYQIFDDFIIDLRKLLGSKAAVLEASASPSSGSDLPEKGKTAGGEEKDAGKARDDKSPGEEKKDDRGPEGEDK